jgi:preprotein translocase subunit SecG
MKNKKGSGRLLGIVLIAVFTLIIFIDLLLLSEGGITGAVAALEISNEDLSNAVNSLPKIIAAAATASAVIIFIIIEFNARDKIKEKEIRKISVRLAKKKK